jgi:aldehyde:ferredoxin oxidoreductase
MYINRVAIVDASKGSVSYEKIDQRVCKDFLGGLGIGAKLLYDHVRPGTSWDDPQNIIVFATGPLNGTVVAGTGSFSVVTKGPLTNGAASSQANGYLGAFMRLSGIESVMIKGCAEKWTYLYVHDGVVELRDASKFVGRDTMETEELIKGELGGSPRQYSVFSIGPAGENLVKFACITGDRGHVAAHNGVGAVLGAKKVKAIVAARGNFSIPVEDEPGLAQVNRDMIARTQLEAKPLFEHGTSFLLGGYVHIGVLPVKNLTTNIFPDYQRLTGEYYRSKFEMRRTPCWRCFMKHCHKVRVTEGSYEGYTADEPDYESFAGWGPLIGQTDPGAVVMLTDTVDRLGLDSNEASWLIAMVMECYEKRILSRSDTDGLEMNWGNVESARSMLRKVAARDGIGGLLAEGVMRAAKAIGGRALDVAVYIEKGHAPRNHDHRARWCEMVDIVTSDCGTIAVGPQPVSDHFSPEAVVDTLTHKRVRSFVDSLVICTFPSMTMATDKIDYLVQMLPFVTGWNYSELQAKETALRIDNLLRVFNIRHGLGPDIEIPSTRYWSAPVDGPAKGRDIKPHWEKIMSDFYTTMGWDRKTGKPLPATLEALGLSYTVKDIWE